jgi:hypothetical protein
VKLRRRAILHICGRARVFKASRLLSGRDMKPPNA